MVDRLYAIELEPEVRAWLESLPAKHFLKGAEVKRALVAKQICEAEYGPAHEEFVRIIERGEIEQ